MVPDTRRLGYAFQWHFQFDLIVEDCITLEVCSDCIVNDSVKAVELHCQGATTCFGFEEECQVVVPILLS